MRVTRRVFLALKWMLFGQFSSQLLFLISSVIYMRRISPEIFGTFALVTLVVDTFSPLRVLRLNTVIIQIDDLNKAIASSINSVSVVIGCVLSLVFFALAPFVVVLYGNGDIQGVFRLMSVSFVLYAIGSTSGALLQRNLLQKYVQFAGLVSEVVAILSSLFLLFHGNGLQALIVNRLVKEFLNSALLIYFEKKYVGVLSHSKFHVDIDRKKIVLGFRIALEKMVWSISKNVDNFFVGRNIGSIDLGLYTRGYTLMMIPVTRFVNIAGSLLLPSLRIVKSMNKKASEEFTVLIKLTCVFIYMYTSTVFLCGDWLIKVVFGQDWLDMIPVLNILVLGTLALSIDIIINPLYVLFDKVKLQLKLTMMYSLLAAFSFFWASKFSIEYVAGSFVVLTIIYTSLKLLGISKAAGSFIKVKKHFSIIFTSQALQICLFLITYMIDGFELLWKVALIGFFSLSLMSIKSIKSAFVKHLK